MHVIDNNNNNLLIHNKSLFTLTLVIARVTAHEYLIQFNLILITFKVFVLIA